MARIEFYWESQSGLDSLGFENGRSNRAATGWLGSGGVFEAPVFVTGFDDLAVMRQAVEERGGYIGVAEDARPFAEGQVGCNDDGRAFLELADQMEQKLPAGLGEEHIAELVKDQEVEPRVQIGIGFELRALY